MIQLKKDPTTGEETMCFLNCSSPLPTTNGLHISASACGSGKTTVISEIAQSHASEGVLIVVPTIEAADELYSKLPISYVLHSKNIGEMEIYRNNPTGLMMKKILVITSARLIIDPIDLFLDFGFEGKKRKYVLIDELINFYPEPYSLPQFLSDTLTYIDRTKTHRTGHLVGSIVVDGRTYYRHTYGLIGELRAAYQSGQHKLFKGKSNALNEYKTNHILQHVLSNGLSPIQQKVIDFADSHIVMLFDGTADIVFGNDKRLLPLSGVRYNSSIEFIHFPMPIKRKNKEGFEVGEFEKYAPELMNLIVDITKSEKLLIVTWKTLEVFKNDLNADELENHKVSYEFPDMLKEKLVSLGAVESNLKVIYRGSGQDRGSNEYRDFGSIMFLGEWNLPDNITSDKGSMFGCKCEFGDYKKSLIVQTICRLQIRKHQGLPIKVYFSDDIDYNLMWEVQEYFKANSEPGCMIKGLPNPCPKYKRPEKGYMIDIAFLEGYDGNIRNAIENNRPYSFGITLDDLYKIIPKGKKAKDRYTTLINYLLKQNITMNLI